MDHILTLITTIENRYKRRQSTYACFVDIKKAFDNVNITCLLIKLRNIDVNSKIYFAVKTIYENMSCAVHVNGIYTDCLACISLTLQKLLKSWIVAQKCKIIN